MFLYTKLTAARCLPEAERFFQPQASSVSSIVKDRPAPAGDAAAEQMEITLGRQRLLLEAMLQQASSMGSVVKISTSLHQMPPQTGFADSSRLLVHAVEHAWNNLT